MNKKSWGVLPKIIISFAILLAVAFSGYLWAYYSARETLRAEIVENNRYATQLISDNVQSTIDTSFSTLFTITQNDVFQNVLTKYRKTGEISGYQRLELRSVLKSMQRPPFEEIFLYIPSLDLIISNTNGSSELNISHQFYYPADLRTYDEWAFLLSTYHLKTIVPINYVNDKPTVMLLTSISSNTKGVPEFTIGCILDRSEILNNMEFANYLGGAVYILNKDGQVIACSQNATGDVPEISDNGQFTIDIEDERYIGTNIVSYDGVRSVSFIPEQAYWQPLTSFRSGMIWGLSAFLVIGVILAVALSRGIYKPIFGMVNSVLDRSGYAWNRETENEVSYVDHTLTRLLSENNVINQQLIDSQSIMKQHFLFEVLNGSLENKEYSEEFEKHGLSKISELFVVASLRMEQQAGTVDNKNGNHRVGQQMETLSSENYKVLAHCFENGLYYLLINIADGTPVAEYDIAKDIRRQINRIDSAVCTITISETCMGAANIPACYDMVKTLYGYRIVDGIGSIILPDRENKENQFKLSKFSENEAILCAYMTDQCEGTAEMIFDQMFDRCFDRKSVSIQDALAFMTHLRIFAVEYAHSIIPVFDPFLVRCVDGITQSDTLPVFRYNCCVFFTHIRTLYTQNQKNDAFSQEIIQYCEAHYTEPDLCINTLGDVFGLSPAYLSQLFRQQQSISLPNYISDIRLSHAVDLLLQTDMRVEDIAASVGIPSVTTFNRLFKKKYSVSPNVYRQISR